MLTVTSAHLRIIAVVSSASLLTDAAMAQGKSNDAFGQDVSARCAQMTDPRVRDDCVRRLKSDAQMGSERSWQGGAANGGSSRGAGAGMGAEHSQGKGRR